MPALPLHLLAEPKREAILRMVWNAERSAGDIAAAFDVSFSAVSQHLALLLGAGLVARRREGRRQFYRACPESLGPLARALEQMWFGGLSTLKALAEKEQAQIDGAAHQHPPRSTHHGRQRPPASARPVPRPGARRRKRRRDR